MNDQLISIQDQITIHKQNLHDLEIKKAKYGSLDVPINILRQIEDEKAELSRLEKEAETIVSSEKIQDSKTTKKRQKNWAIIIPVVVAVIGLMGTGITAFVDYLTSQIPIKASQTAQALSISLTQTAQFTINITPIQTQSPIFTSTPTLEIIQPPTLILEQILTFTTPQKQELNSLPTIFGDYIGINKPDTYTYYQAVHATQSFFWKYEWCAKYQGTLDDNLTKMTFSYLMNDNPIPESDFLVYEHGTANGWACQTWATMLTNWTPGERITLTAQYKIAKLLSDGETMYPPGEYRHDLIVTVKP